MKNLVSQENIKTVVVSAVLHGTWELIFTETVSSTPENVKASFKRHQMNHFTVLHGTVDGCLGTERFNSFPHKVPRLNRRLSPLTNLWLKNE